MRVAAGPGGKFALSQVAVLYRCVATGSVFQARTQTTLAQAQCCLLLGADAWLALLQAALRARGIPFNSHGVAFYRRKARSCGPLLLFVYFCVLMCSCAGGARSNGAAHLRRQRRGRGRRQAVRAERRRCVDRHSLSHHVLLVEHSRRCIQAMRRTLSAWRPSWSATNPRAPRA